MRLVLTLLTLLLCIDMIIGIGGTAITHSKTPSGGTPSGYDPDAQTYINAVEAADGQTLETSVKDAINAFVVGCKSDGIWSAIKAACIMAGARTLLGALKPLVGTAPTNNNFVSGDYDRKTGLVGDASTKYLDSNRNNNADPQDDCHRAIYVTENTIVASVIGHMGSGVTEAGRSNIGHASSDGTGVFFRANNSTSYFIGSDDRSGTQIWGVSRSAGASYTVRYKQTNYTASIASETPQDANIKIFWRGSGNYSPSRLSFYSIGEALDLALLDSRVSTLMTAIGAAIP